MFSFSSWPSAGFSQLADRTCVSVPSSLVLFCSPPSPSEQYEPCVSLPAAVGAGELSLGDELPTAASELGLSALQAQAPLHAWKQDSSLAASPSVLALI